MFRSMLQTKKLVTSALLFSFIFSHSFFLLPQRAEATASGSTVIVGADITRDPIMRVLNGIAWAITKRLVAEITNSIVNWINSGFQGDPIFITNPEAFLLDVVNEVSGQFISELGLSAICDPYRPQILIALAQTDTFSARSQCTLLDAVDNIEGFLDDFSQGGWEGWIQLTQEPQNNIYGGIL